MAGPAYSRLYYNRIGYCALTSDTLPKLTHFEDRCRHATNKNKSPFESRNYKTDSSFTVVAKLFLTFKHLKFVNYDVWTGCPKLGNATLQCVNYMLCNLQRTKQYRMLNTNFDKLEMLYPWKNMFELFLVFATKKYLFRQFYKGFKRTKFCIILIFSHASLMVYTIK